MTTFELDEFFFQALRAGAVGFLINAPRAATAARASFGARGDDEVQPSMTVRLITQNADAGGPARGLDELTARERDVRVLIAHGESNSEMARTLVIGETTVKTHLSRILTSSTWQVGPRPSCWPTSPGRPSAC